MTVFEYVAYDTAGQSQRGAVEAHSPEDARASLRARRLYVSRIRSQEAGRGGGGRLGGLLRWDRPLDLAMPLRELATLLTAGVPLVQALEALARESGERSVRMVLRGLRDRVQRGESLSTAAGAYPRYFGSVARQMVAAGETGGHLDAAVRRLSEHLLRMQRLRGKVAAALAYPAALALISGGVVVFLLTYVVPRISVVYLETGRQLPLATRMLIRMSGFLQSYWLIVLGVLALACVGFRYLLRDERVALCWDRAKLRAPFVGPLLLKRCIADFSATLCALLQAGVPLVDALRVTGRTLGNRLAAQEVRGVADDVELGSPTSDAVRERRVFPATVAELIAAGEESGEMVGLLEVLAEDYAQQVEVAAERACRVLEPLVVVFMGGVVLFIVLSVLLPIVRISQFVSF